MLNFLGRHRALVGALVATGALAVAPAAMATPGPYQWLGGASSGDWSAPANWTAGHVPTAGVSGGFTFGACTAVDCDTSVDDLAGVTTTSLNIADNEPYEFGQDTNETLTIGGPSPTLTAQAAGAGTGPSPEFNLPVSLSGSQAWTINGNGNGDGIGFQDPITDSTLADTFGVTLSGNTTLGLRGANNVGAVTVSGDPANTGFGSAQNGNVSLDGSLNATSLRPVTFQNTELFAESSTVATGPLTMTGGSLSLAADTGQDTTLQVGGALSFDSHSALDMAINGAGTAAGTDFNQITATSDVHVGGDLELFGPNADDIVTPCVTFVPGTSDTLISTAGALTGTFTDLPNGGMTSLDNQCGNAHTEVPVRINYTATSVTATPMTGSTTTLQAQDQNNIPLTNQALTLVATVSQTTGTATGSVAFTTDSGGDIPGCAEIPVAGGTATCTTSGLGALSAPYDVTAAYSPSDGTVEPTQDDSFFDILPDSTTTSISASNMNPHVGDAVTYTATVGHADSGAFSPSSDVLFFTQGQTDDQDVQLCPDAPGTMDANGTVTCTTTYAGAGAPAVFAVYIGDGNFDFSESDPLAVTVSAPASGAPPTPAPAPTVPAAGTGVSKVQTPVAKNGAVNIPLSCAAGGASCTVTTKITVVETLHKHGKVVHRTVVIGSETTTIAAGASHSVHVTLSRAGRKLLAKNKSLKTTVRVTSTSAGSTKTIAAKKLTLTAAKGHHKKK
jgi:large repetitive protein